MLLRHKIQLAVAAAALLFPVGVVLAGNIVPGKDTARFYDTGSRINLGLPQGDVTVTDTEVTGYAWSEDWGWINLQPNDWGVKNDKKGNLSGYAWGENLGWINFSPTYGGVTISGSGHFSGYAWSENGGWIEFNCLTGSCVQTTWTADDPTPPGGGGSTPPTQVIPPDEEGPAEEPTPDSPEDPEEEPPVDVTPDPELPTEEPPAVEPDPTDTPEPEDQEDEEVPTTPGGPTTPPGEEPGGSDPVSPLTPIIELIDSFFNDPVLPSVTSIIAGVAGAVGIMSSTGIFLSSLSITNVLFWPLRLWNLILALFGFRKKREPWGTVYDSVTKQPLDPAYVQLINKETGKEEEGALTDLDGRFGFMSKVGRYTMNARKTNYVFPSERLAGKSSDILYDHLYFGGDITIESDNDVVLRNIPLDPVGVDWNEVQKRKKGLFNFYSKYDVAFYTLTTALFYLGLIVAVVAAFFFPSILHAVILAVYIVIIVIRSITGSPKNLGAIYDTTGEPLSYAAVKVYLANSENQVKQVVANQFGKFYCLVTPGSYYVKIFKRVGEEELEEIYTSEVFHSKNGLIDRTFTVGRN